ncbi:polysaccharide biosynthesis protein [Micromonospora kangleipakensis]|uniref:Polysaccharide biosynthesis protein n=1 Tax=Micromonospora kangleipakensis TaxID=1077942 RepID=A0A4Q8BH56_9ACTN|nr:oligosaccharide flippase family protein [Micromonospora kangleipakensis]RZU76673.1 polysaccharide biosynthesis protein [Micromonospora kangleipakensis]
MTFRRCGTSRRAAGERRPRGGLLTTDASVGRAAPGVGTVAEPIGVRLRQHLRDPLNGNVYALMLNTAVSSLLGIAYWALAARLYSPAELGIGAAKVSTMSFLSNLSQLNLNGALARFLPTAAAQGSRLVGYAYGVSCLAALVLSGGFLLLAPMVAGRLEFLHRTPLLAVAFALCVAGVSWNLAVVATLIPVNVLVFRRLLPRLRARRTEATLPDRPVLIARIVVQLTAQPARRKVLRILDMVAAPLLVAFVIVIIQRFRDLS